MDERIRHQVLGAGFMLSSVLFFVVMNALTKYCGLPSAEKVFFRMLLGALVMFAMIRVGLAGMEFNNIPLLALRGILGAVAVLFYFHAIDNTTLGRAVFFQFTYPAWGAVFSYFFLKETLGWKRFPALAATFAGAYLILVSDGKLTVASVRSGDVSGLLCGLFSGAAVTTVRGCHKYDSTYMIFLFFAMFGTAAGAVFTFAFGDYVAPATAAWAVLLAIGATGTVAQLLLTSAYKYLDVAAAGSIAMLQAPLSAVVGFAFFSEKLAPCFACGAALVLAGGIHLATSSAGAVMREAPDSHL